MSLIKCPECGREISDKAIGCPWCGIEFLKGDERKETIVCSCGFENDAMNKFCSSCGKKLRKNEEENQVPEIPYYSVGRDKKSEKKIERAEATQEETGEFSGIYKYSFLGKKMEVRCPRCHSENCSHYQEQKIIPGKTKERYTMNLNPLHPFTLVNKKEKIVKKEKSVTESKIVCNECGYIFK